MAVIVFVNFKSDAKEDAFSLSAIMPNMILLTLLYTALGVTLRNYSTHKHNYIVNKHRQNALSTFEAFVNATDDPDIKNAVLLKATHSIFALRDSGYLKNEGESVESREIIDVVRPKTS